MVQDLAHVTRYAGLHGREGQDAGTIGFGKADSKCLEERMGLRRRILAIQVECGWGRDDSQGTEFWFKHT